MKTAELPRRQAEILETIYRLTEKNGFVPAIRDLCVEVRLKSTATVHYHLTGLAERKLVQWEPGKNRAIQITDRGRAYLGVKIDKPKVSELRPVCKHCKGTGLAY